MCNSRIVGEADLPVMWSHLTLLKRVVKGENSGTAMGDQERSKPQTPRFMHSGTLLFYPRICLLGLNRSKKPAKHRQVSRFQTHYPGPVLANAGHDCNPCDRPLKVIMQRKKRTNILVYYCKFG